MLLGKTNPFADVSRPPIPRHLEYLINFERGLLGCGPAAPRPLAVPVDVRSAPVPQYGCRMRCCGWRCPALDGGFLLNWELGISWLWLTQDLLDVAGIAVLLRCSAWGSCSSWELSPACANLAAAKYSSWFPSHQAHFSPSEISSPPVCFHMIACLSRLLRYWLQIPKLENFCRCH